MTEQETRIRVGICGAAGRMGREVVKAVLAEPDLSLVMAVSPTHAGQDAGTVAGLPDPIGIVTGLDLETALAETRPEVVVDFTEPQVVFQNSQVILRHKAHAVIGTTGLDTAQMRTLAELAEANGRAILIAPNFAIGAVLLMKFAQEASQYFDHAEIIELHHNRKLDAPSGTALRTAELMRARQPRFGPSNIEGETETIPGARGATTDSNLHIHSIRLPGLVAHEEVIFGAPGQTLTLRHDSLDRTSFMPGVIQAIRKIGAARGLLYGLENLL